MAFDTSAKYAARLDREDPLARFRKEFVVDDRSLIYLDGNSLGRLPKRSAKLMREVVERQWGQRMIRAWGDSWFTMPQRLGAKIAGLIGARPDEVIVCDSTSVDFFKLVTATMQCRIGRNTIVTDDLNFPSDLYLLQGCASLLPNVRVETVRSEDGMTISSEEIAARLNDDTALLTLSHASFKSGFLHDMKAVTAEAQRAGAWTLWDLSHSVGAASINLNGANAELAVGCTYKYLNGGPGSPAFLYVRKDLQPRLINPIWGWFGRQMPFAFELEYEPADGIDRFLSGTPPILSMACVECGVDLVLEAGMENIRAKSVLQTGYLVGLWEALLEPLGVSLNSPRDPTIRGSHVSFGHPQGLAVDLALIEEMKVIPDFRAPDNIRFGASPLYTSFSELREGVERMCQVIAEHRYEKYAGESVSVT